jgi:FkbM family methyltransferase
MLSEGATYVGADGFVFEIDLADPFQATMLLGLYDPVVEWILRRYIHPGTSVVDAGAHLGYFSLRMARLVGPAGAVHCFECDPRLVGRLERHVQLNEVDWVRINACGLLDRDLDHARLYLPSQLGWSSTLEGAWDARDFAAVRMVTLDSYMARNGIEPEQLGFVKLDVEGSELQALQGAREVLRATSAPVLVEYLPGRMVSMGQDPDDLLSLMADAEFHPWSPTAVKRGQVVMRPGAAPRIGEDVLFLKRTRV